MAASKPGLVHYSAILLGMLFIGFAVATYMQTKTINENSARWAQASADADAARQTMAGMDEEIEAMKGWIGHQYEDVGVASDGGAAANTVAAGKNADFDAVEGAVGSFTGGYQKAVEKLLLRIKEIETERNNVETDKLGEHKQLLEIQQLANNQISTHQQARAAAETERDKIQRTADEQIEEKNKEIAELSQQTTILQQELDDEIDAHQKDVKRLKQEITDLQNIADKLREKLDEATKVSFERPDGIITWVDNQSRRVWINLGSADFLNKQMTFSIYTKDNRGVGRGIEDIKGSIEVTRIIDSHNAEARILDDDIYRPFAKGDPIFTPLWSPGRPAEFAVVGSIDLDRDGAPDRERFHQIISGAGATLAHEVDDDGTRLRYTKFPEESLEFEEGTQGIDVNTKFLVIGEIPDMSELSKQEDIDRAQRITGHLQQMRKEARIQGVRIVSLNDFLSWLGYRPQRRLFIPGLIDRPFNLKAGAHSTATNGHVGDRSSSGQVSGAYGKSKRLKQKSSTGQTSKLFSGGY